MPRLLCLITALLLSFQVQAADSRPNIVFILLDDLDEIVSPYWDAMPATAALVRDNGVRFNNAFAPTPICCPARSTILTGKYGHNTGVLTNGGDRGGWQTFVANGNEERTFPLWLQQAGYYTGHVGKYLNGIETAPTHVPPGYSEWVGAADNFFYQGYNYSLNENGTLVKYGNDEADYATDVVSRKAVDFIQRASTREQPFMLMVAPTAPHLPLPPARRHADHPYRDAEAPRRPNYNEENLQDKPKWLRTTGDQRKAIVNAWNDTDYRLRMGSLYAADEMVAAIVEALKTSGEFANTWIVFTSDNGYNLGAHRLIHKMAPYEESIRVPLVILGPDIPAALRGTTLDPMVLELDFAPTIAQLAGVDVPSDVDGRSLLPWLQGQAPSQWRTDFLLQYVTAGAANGIGTELPAWLFVALGQEIPSYRALRTQTHLYVEWYEDPRVEHDVELYDLKRDPYQLHNLLSNAAGRTANAAQVETLRERLDALATCQGNDCRQ